MRPQGKRGICNRAPTHSQAWEATPQSEQTARLHYLFLDAGDRPQSPQAYFPGTDLDGRKEQELSRTLELAGEDAAPPAAQPHSLQSLPAQEQFWDSVSKQQACAYPTQKSLPEPGWNLLPGLEPKPWQETQYQHPTALRPASSVQ